MPKLARKAGQQSNGRHGVGVARRLARRAASGLAQVVTQAPSPPTASQPLAVSRRARARRRPEPASTARCRGARCRRASLQLEPSDDSVRPPSPRLAQAGVDAPRRRASVKARRPGRCTRRARRRCAPTRRGSGWRRARRADQFEATACSTPTTGRRCTTRRRAARVGGGGGRHRVPDVLRPDGHGKTYTLGGGGEAERSAASSTAPSSSSSVITTATAAWKVRMCYIEVYME